jgi:hypothetical protein
VLEFGDVATKFLRMTRISLPICLVVFAFIALSSGCETPLPLGTATIGSSSMEPTLVGPRVVGECESCLIPFSFSEESALRVSVLRCPRCRELIAAESETLDRKPGQAVMVEPVDELTKLCRGEMVLFDNSDTSPESNESLQSERSPRMIKRLVGFPNESLSISEGDLFVNGRRWEKSASQFYASAIGVGAWPEAVEYLTGKAGHRPTCAYEPSSLWPRTDLKDQRRPSPILDELDLNADEPFVYTAVHDVGVVFQLTEGSAIDFELVVAIWSRGALRSVLLTFHDDRCHFSPGAGEESRSGATIGCANKLTTKELGLSRVLVAAVDGRIVVAAFNENGIALGERYWPQYECLDQSGRFEQADCGMERPVAVAIEGSYLDLASVDIVRDIHYRGPRGENEYDLPRVPALHVLGDNVSIASDSRSELSAGVERRLITGRIAPSFWRFSPGLRD